MNRCAGLVFLCLLMACNSADKPVQPVYQPHKPTTKSINPDVFNHAFSQLLMSYYSLKDGLIAETADSNMNYAAVHLMNEIDSLPLSVLPVDSSRLDSIREVTASITAELTGFRGEKELMEKRKEFQLISEQLYELIKAVQYDHETIYHCYCPNAFPDQGAYWLNSSPVIKNPYNPKKMPDCGEVKAIN